MTARKAAPKQGKAGAKTCRCVKLVAALAEMDFRIETLAEDTADAMIGVDGLSERLSAAEDRIQALESRALYRDASHDEPISNHAEAVGHRPFGLSYLLRIGK